MCYFLNDSVRPKNKFCIICFRPYKTLSGGTKYFFSISSKLDMIEFEWIWSKRLIWPYFVVQTSQAKNDQKWTLGWIELNWNFCYDVKPESMGLVYFSIIEQFYQLTSLGMGEQTSPNFQNSSKNTGLVIKIWGYHEGGYAFESRPLTVFLFFNSKIFYDLI